MRALATDPLDPLNVDRRDFGVLEAARAAGFALVDVRRFGVAADGVTDDSARFQEAIDTLSLAGGGVLAVPRGTYAILTGLVWREGVSLAGEGWESVFAMGGTDLRQQGGIIDAMRIDDVFFADFAITGEGESNGISLHGCNRVTVRNVKVAFSSSRSNTGCICIYDDGSHERGTSTGIRVTGCHLQPSALAVLAQGDPVGPFWLEDIVVDNNLVDGVAADPGTYEGIKIDLHSRAFNVSGNVIRGRERIRVGIHSEEDVTDGRISGNVVDACTSRGIRIDGGQTSGAVQRVLITNNTVYGMRGAGRAGIGIDSRPGSAFREIRVHGNVISDVQNGIREATPDSRDLTITDNVINGFTDQGIYVRSPRTVITGNSIAAAAGVLAGAIVADSTATNCLIAGNYLGASSARGVVLSGSGAAGLVVRDNTGLSALGSGRATLPAGAVSVVVGHGLGVIPTADIVLTPISGWGGATAPRVVAVTTAEFTVFVDRAPEHPVVFEWAVR